MHWSKNNKIRFRDKTSGWFIRLKSEWFKCCEMLGQHSQLIGLTSVIHHWVSGSVRSGSQPSKVSFSGSWHCLIIRVTEPQHAGIYRHVWFQEKNWDFFNITGNKKIFSSLTVWLFESRKITEDFQCVSVRGFLSQTHQHTNPTLQIGKLTRPRARTQEPFVFWMRKQKVFHETHGKKRME